MSDLIVWTLDWVPEGPRGFVRDLRLRWAYGGLCRLPTPFGVVPPKGPFIRSIANTGFRG